MQFRLLKAVLLSFMLAGTAVAGPTAESITNHLKAKNWAQADRELRIYLKEKPDQAWAYSSHAWALENLLQFDSAIAAARDGLKRWPADRQINAALSRVLIKKAEGLPAASAHPLFEEAAQRDPREYTEFCLAKSFRSLGRFEEAILLLKKGAADYPDSERFREALPYTRYLAFKSARASGNKDLIRRHTEEAARSLLNGEYRQYYPRLILRFGLRDLEDRAYFQSVYDGLFKRFPEDPWLHDDYGFQLYANYRLNDPANRELLKEAISWRRKAYDLYWKTRLLPPPVRGLDFPLRGPNLIMSQFGGKAMTHNGFSNYCYDFAAVDQKHNLSVPGNSGRRNEDYFMFGKPVFAAADGEVVGVIDGFPDNDPGGYSGDANTITIQHSGYLSFYAHMKNGGILVKAGQRVRRGDTIGYAGNSGMSSVSHLHFCILAAGTDEVSIPFEFNEAQVEKPDGRKIRTVEPYMEDDVVSPP